MVSSGFGWFRGGFGAKSGGFGSFRWVRVVPHLSKIFGLIRAGFGLVSYFWRKIIVKTTFELLLRLGSGGFVWVWMGSEPNRVGSVVGPVRSTGFGWVRVVPAFSINTQKIDLGQSIAKLGQKQKGKWSGCVCACVV